MDDFIGIEIEGRNIDISKRVYEMLEMMKAECIKKKISTAFIHKLRGIAIYFRLSPDYVLRYLEPVLAMIQNNIHPDKALVLFEEFFKIELMARMHAEQSVKKRMAQESRIANIQHKRDLFAKIKLQYEYEKKQKNGRSLKELLDENFPEISQKGEKAFENLRQQYYRTIRREVGVKKDRIADENLVKAEFLNSYLLDNAGIVKEVDDGWSFFELQHQFGKSRSRIDRIMSRQKYEKKYKRSRSKHLKRKKQDD